MKKTIKKISATAVSALLAACSLGSFPATTASMLTTIEKTPRLINFDISGEGVSIAENEDGEKIIADIPDSSGKNDPENALLHTERKAILYAALDELSDEHKEILLLRDINGYSYEEVGARLGLEAGTVKSRLFRAREALRKKLEEKNYF